MKEAYRMYNRMKETFVEHTNENDFYDVDMYCSDLRKSIFIETDPQDIDEDDYLVFQEALVLLVRDDMLFNWFGLSGIMIIQAEMLHYGKQYYENKIVFKGFKEAVNETSNRLK